MPPEAVAAATVVTLVAGGLAILEFTVKPIRRYLLKRTDPPVVTPDQLRDALSEQKREILDGVEQVFNHHFGIGHEAAQQLVAASDEERLRLLGEATKAQREQRYAEAVDLLRPCLRPDLPPEERAALHNIIGNSYMYMGEQAKAEPHYREVLSAGLQADDKQAQAVSLGNLGIVYFQRGDLGKAEKHHRKALAIDEEISNERGQADQLGSLGLIYSQRGDPDAAEDHYKRALAIHKENGDELREAYDHGNLGNLYLRRGDLDEAERCYRRVLRIHQKIEDKSSLAIALGNLGRVYASRGDLEAAEEHHRKALAIDEEIGNRLGQAIQLGNLGLLAEERGDRTEARRLLRQAGDLYEAIGAGGHGPETIAQALQRLEAAQAKE